MDLKGQAHMYTSFENHAFVTNIFFIFDIRKMTTNIFFKSCFCYQEMNTNPSNKINNPYWNGLFQQYKFTYM